MIVEMVQYGTSEKANANGAGTPIIRMNNIVDGELDLLELKHIVLRKTDTDKLLLRDGDLLFNRTNSKELVGKCAVFHEKGDFIFASYIIRLRTKAAKADPDFVAYVLNSAIGRQQIDALSRQIIGQANVNSVELRGLQIPLPPLGMQRHLMEHVAAGRMEIAREREAAKDLARKVSIDIESLIFGIRSSC